MTRLAFFKLNVADMDPALAFWREAFGFTVAMTFDEPHFLEHVLDLPGQEAGPSLMLVAWKDERETGVGHGHGPVGFMTDDIETVRGKAIAAGATALGDIFEAAGVRIAMLASPQGHEIELVQLPTG